jgi:uncharacterized membrane protein
MAGLAYYILARSLIAQEGQDSELAHAVGRDRKGILSLVVYSAAILACFVSAALAFGLYIVVAVIWFVPDRRIERALGQRG